MTREDFEKLSGEEWFKLFNEAQESLQEEKQRSDRMMSLLTDDDQVFKPFVVNRLSACERRQRRILLAATIAGLQATLLMLFEVVRFITG